MRQFLKLTAKFDGSKFLVDVADVKSVMYGVDDEKCWTIIEVYSSSDDFYCKESVEQVAAALASFEGSLIEVRSASVTFI